MSLTVENGTGLADADAYISLADWKSWADGRGRSYADHDDAAIEAAIREGFQYVNTVQRYKAMTLTAAQSGEFPREGLTDWNGRTVEGVPQRVVWANAELAYARLIGGEDLFQILDRGGRVASESVGPISVSYFDDAPAGKTFLAAMKLLEPYAREKNQLFAGFIGGAAGQSPVADGPTELNEQFVLNMHANLDD